jgi:UDP-N-acetylmuramoyl-L-alanyl-D-glutamate--2,6-diaminopimelate ligase
VIAKKMSRLLEDIATISTRGRSDPLIHGISYDSRHIKKGFLFVSLPGLHTDGHLYIDSAIHNGALAVVHQDELDHYVDTISYIRVENCRKALSQLSAGFYDHPSKKMIVIGVTGTDGKSTTVWFIHQLLESMGIHSGFLSTVQIQYNKEVDKNPLRQSTPEAPEVHEILSKMVQSGKTHAVLEATSHGLSEQTNRLTDVYFDVAVLTNVAHEHLEFHGSFEQYRSDKANLFRMLDIPVTKSLSTPDSFPPERRFGVINADDPAHLYFHEVTKTPLYTYGLKDKGADIVASDIEHHTGGSHFSILWKGERMRAALPVPGIFNIENALAAALTVTEICQVHLQEVIKHFPILQGVTGRMTTIDCGQPFLVIVDYAHTPQAFDKLLSMMRPLTKGQLIAVFGSAGERDMQKRAMQGNIASLHADIVILTDEDPRLEDRCAILENIASGCAGLKRGKTLFLEPDREKAIALAFSLAKENDTVLLLGKGHEASILYPEGPFPWNEQEVAERLLSLAGYRHT